MRSNSRKMRDNFNQRIESIFRKKKYRLAALKRLKRMDGGYECKDEYEEIVVPYWKKYGYKPDKFWYQIFSDREHKVDPRYIPDDLYFGELVPYFSNTQFRRFGEDKCYHDIWFPDIVRPGTICKNIAGVFYDTDMNIISYNDAVDLCLDYKDEFLIKPSIDSGEGRLIKFFEPGEANIHTVRTAFNDIEANFIVQASVKQHPELGKLNPSSLNSIRVVSLFFNNEVHILSCILRVGAKNSKVDNIGAGGFACPILKDGQLKDKAVNRKAEWVTDNSEGVKFCDVKVPNFEDVLEVAKKAHKRLAHFKLIGWDFSVDTDGNPVLIEYNSCPGPNQITCGPTFGDLTEEVLEEYFINKTLKNAQN